MKNNKGFTLVELIVVIAIIAIASGLIATRFLGLIDDTKQFDRESVAKGIAEAAYVYIDDKANKDTDPDDCKNAEVLVNTGVISENQGLLKECKLEDCIKNFYFKVTKINGKKVAQAFYNDTSCSGDECCSGQPLKEY